MLNMFNNKGDKVELLESKDFEASTSYIKIPFLNYAIVFMKKDFSGSFVSQGGEYRLILNNPFTFPFKFVEYPVIISSTANVTDYAYCNVVGLLRKFDKVTQIVLGRPTAINNTTVGVQIIAIGKYK